MTWLLFAVFASAVYAVTNFVDKYILEKQINDYRGLVIYSAFVSFVFGSLCWILVGFPVLIPRDTILVISTGVLTIWGLALYFRALSSEETSTVIILMQMIPVITLLLSAIFLHERISSSQIYGFILIIGAIIGVSLKKEQLRMRLSSALLFVLLADFFWASANVLFKFVVSSENFSQLIAYESWGIALGGVIIYCCFPTVRSAFHKIKNSISKRALGFILINEVIFLIAKLLAFFAISLGPVSLVTIVGSTQVFFGIFYGWLLGALNWKIGQENISTFAMVKKLSLSVLGFAGIWLMQY